MSQSKFRFKVLGLCLVAVLGVMVFGATGAGAKGHWFVNLVLLNTTIGVEALEPTGFSLLSTYGLGKKIEIRCTLIKVDDGLLFSGGSSLGEILFSACDTYLSLVQTANCKPLEPIVAKVKNLLIHHNNDTYILFSPHDGLTFITLHLGALCAAGQNIQVKGNVVVECGVLNPSWTHEDCSHEEPEHQIQEVPGTTLFPNDRLKFGPNAASLDNDISLRLKSPHQGVKWGGLTIL